jgi:hypothetical protein
MCETVWGEAYGWVDNKKECEHGKLINGALPFLIIRRRFTQST